MSGPTGEQTDLQRSLGQLDGTMLVAGSMIGSGIFIVSADIARTVGSMGYLVLVWGLPALYLFAAATVRVMLPM